MPGINVVLAKHQEQADKTRSHGKSGEGRSGQWVVPEAGSRQQDELHYTQAGPYPRKSSPRDIGIALDYKIRNFVELLVFG